MRTSFIVFYLFFLAKGFSQENKPIKQVLNRIDSFYQLTPLEKAYIHTDKDWYTVGENIWFKAYITVDNQLENLSNVFYVDLINEKDSVVLKSMWKVSQNSFNGDLYLPLELPEGSYKLKIYSLWMLNTHEVVYEKYVQIISANNKVQAIEKNVAPNIRINLFPEGGFLVNGLLSKMAYKVTDKYGLPIENIKIQIEENGVAIATDTITHDGMGAISFIPNSKRNYTCKFKINGVWYIPDLPIVKEKGYVLSVNTNNPNRLFFNIQHSPITNEQDKPTVWLIGHIGGVTYYAEKIILEDSITAGAISTKNLPHGVLNLTVFNEQLIPEIERLVFIRKVTAIVPEISVVKKGLGAKEKNSISVNISSDTALLSISVASTEQIDTRFKNANIVDYFLFKSEVKGYVHNPGFYFESNDSLHKAALDLLLLTQGWRRFMWKDVQANQLPILNYFIETGISVRGTVTEKISKQSLIKDAKVDFILKGEDSTSIIATTQIQERGQFVLNNLDFRKKASVFYKGSQMNTIQSVDLSIYPNYFDTIRFHKLGYINLFTRELLAPAKKTSLLNQYSLQPITTTPNLAAVTVYTKIKTPEQKLTDEYVSDWYKNSDFTFIPDSLSGFSSIWQWLQAKVPGLSISGDIFNPTVNFNRYRGGITDPSLLSETVYETLNTVNGEVKSSIAFFINEMPVSIDQVNSLSPKDIALIKVNRTPNLVGNATAGSMFLYTSKSYNWSLAKGMDKATISGYTIAKEYFSPIYETPESKAVIDKRSSLYWNPNVKKSNGKINFYFYNSDFVKKYTIIVEGLSKTGIPIRAEKYVD
jgi:hypothetical protein